MEEYIVESGTSSQPTISIKQGKYYMKVHQKHIEAYGDFGAANIRDNIMSTYSVAIEGANGKPVLVAYDIENIRLISKTYWARRERLLL